jgi:hypothetical protein
MSVGANALEANCIWRHALLIIAGYRLIIRVSEKNNCAGLRRDLVHLQGGAIIFFRGR